MALALVSLPAGASYSDGAYGLFLALFSVPVGLVAIVLTTVLYWKRAFRSRGFAYGYVALFCAAALSVVAMSTSAGETASVLTVAVVEAMLLLPIVGPALLQCWSADERDE
ncbi:hypothetical protein K4L06_13390 [Lysobacter sp. BMK333-48F3]|uniref:hypothetical protein n=1 Tax=Lysobacter sp. BMK333-48F3 TaxID=2867962 RepID=UPI001C8B9115|nr:hypothetical protein [Lysobacter sp. BMK333-48F3]MBX9402302.1 hypothetical protein [Lysobacter sp. BMK333-48F3]